MSDEMEFIANWPSDPSWRQIHDDGHETVDNVTLPPLRVLSQHAERLVRGQLIANRIGGWQADWNGRPLWKAIDEDRGYLDVNAKLDRFHGLGWRIAFQISADPEANGHASSFMSPSMALAWMIAVVEEHEIELRAGLVEHTGGLA